MTSSLASAIARPPLETVTAAFAASLDGPPPYELSLEQARAGLPALQAAAAAQRPPASIEDRVIPGGPTGEVAIRIVRPLGVPTPAPVVVYGHGGEWVFGDPGTHERLVRELAVAAHAVVVFVDYTRVPEARHPVQVRQGETVLAWITEHGASAGLDPGGVAVAGDSSGANLATVWAMLSRDRPGIDLAAQVLLFPDRRRQLRHRLLPRVRRRALPRRAHHALVLEPLPPRCQPPRGRHRQPPTSLV
jgi:acetyl esterase